jgi:hypothetical protein
MFVQMMMQVMMHAIMLVQIMMRATTLVQMINDGGVP